MKRILFTAIIAVFALGGANAKDLQQLVVTTNPPLSCQNCENKIKKNIRFEKGVTNIETNIKEQRVVITYDADKTNPDNIAEGVGKIGYPIAQRNNCCYPTPSECCTEGAKCCQPIPLNGNNTSKSDVDTGATINACEN